MIPYFVNTSDGRLKNCSTTSLSAFVCFPAGTGGGPETNGADCRHTQRTMDWAESSGAADRLRHDVYVRFLHSIYVHQPNILRVSHCEQPSAPAAGWSSPDGHWVLRHGIHTLLDLQCGKQRHAQREFTITFSPTTVLSIFGISAITISEKSSWYNMAAVLASPLSSYCTGDLQRSQALSMSEVGRFCAFWNETPIIYVLLTVHPCIIW